MRVERQVLFWLAAIILAALAVFALKSVLLPFVMGMVIAYALNPIADQLVRLGMPRLLASAIIVALLVALLVVMLAVLVPLLITQAQQFAAALPGEIERLKGMLESMARERLGSRYPEFKDGLDRVVAELSQNWSALAGALAQYLWSGGVALVNFLSLLLIMPLVVFYLLVDWHPMLERINGWLPRDHEAAIRRLAGEINSAIAAFIRGQGLVCLILGTLYAAGLTWIGLRYGLLIGLMSGLLSFIPFLGWALGLITAGVFAAVQFWPEQWPIVIVVAVFIFGQALDTVFLSPKLVGARLGLHPVWLIFALFVFSALFGFVGVLMAVPVAAAAAVLVRFALEVYLSSSIYLGRRLDETSP